MYYYKTGPIDYWAGLLSIEEYCDAVRNELVGLSGDINSGDNEIAEILDALEKSKIAMGYWDDAVTAGPFVFLLPDDENYCMSYGFIWKHNDNGRTSIASPFLLPWIYTDTPLSDTGEGEMSAGQKCPIHRARKIKKRHQDADLR